jgi:hypothetical protein
MSADTSPPLKASLNHEDRRLSVKRLLRALCVYLTISMLGIAITACASRPRLADHTFEFDTRTDSPDTEILDWRYGDSKVHGTRPETYVLRSGRIPQQIGTSGEMKVGNDLYVKWRSRSTNEIFENTVDLRDKLPGNIENHTIRFIANQSQLYVYLITPTRKAPNPCPPDRRRLILDRSGEPDRVMFSMYCSRVILRLHPVSGVVPAFN